MKVFELMAALAFKPAGAEVVLHFYNTEGKSKVEVVDYDLEGNVAISGDRKLFERYNKNLYDEEPTSDGE